MPESNEPFKEKLDRRVFMAMLEDAFFRWESAVVIALTLLLFFFSTRIYLFREWLPWAVLAGGAVAEIALLAAAISEPETGRRAVARLFEQQYDPNEINDRRNRERIRRALEYRAKIEELVRRQHGPRRVRLSHTAASIDEWIGQIYNLARRLDAFRRDSLIHRDLESVPKALDELYERLKRESDPKVRAELERTIKAREAQMANLETLENMMKRADIQMDNTLAALGTVYAQMQLIDVREVDSGRAQRLQKDINDQIAALQDTIYAMDAVYRSREGGESG